jgi:hypothetical protein
MISFVNRNQLILLKFSEMITHVDSPIPWIASADVSFLPSTLMSLPGGPTAYGSDQRDPTTCGARHRADVDTLVNEVGQLPVPGTAAASTAARRRHHVRWRRRPRTPRC